MDTCDFRVTYRTLTPHIRFQWILHGLTRLNGLTRFNGVIGLIGLNFLKGMIIWWTKWLNFYKRLTYIISYMQSYTFLRDLSNYLYTIWWIQQTINHYNTFCFKFYGMAAAYNRELAHIIFYFLKISIIQMFTKKLSLSPE